MVREIGAERRTALRPNAYAGIVVGASFMISPVSPISIFDTEAIATHMIRADFGAFICFTICAAQASYIIN